MGDRSPIVGIDLGTTNSAAAVWHEGCLRLLDNELGEVLTPSAVAETPQGGIVVGREAKDMLARYPERGALGFKRWMGEDRKVRVGSRELRPEELSAYVLDALRLDVERTWGTAIDRCVVSVPAYFGERQRFATRKAAEMAGWVVERIINEPTAAALAYGLGERERELTFVVLDIGGGTFDVCVMEHFEGLLEVKGVSGISQLGGDDFTRVLAEFCLRRAGHPYSLDRLSPRVRARVVMRAELLKRQLSRWPQAETSIPVTDDPEGESVTVTMTAAEADDVYAPLLAQLAKPCREALLGAKISPEQLGEVLLVGGASAMPAFLRARLENSSASSPEPTTPPICSSSKGPRFKQHSVPKTRASPRSSSRTSYPIPSALRSASSSAASTSRATSRRSSIATPSSRPLARSLSRRSIPISAPWRSASTKARQGGWRATRSWASSPSKGSRAGLPGRKSR